MSRNLWPKGYLNIKSMMHSWIAQRRKISTKIFHLWEYCWSLRDVGLIKTRLNYCHKIGRKGCKRERQVVRSSKLWCLNRSGWKGWGKTEDNAEDKKPGVGTQCAMILLLLLREGVGILPLMRCLLLFVLRTYIHWSLGSWHSKL